MKHDFAQARLKARVVEALKEQWSGPADDRLTFREEIEVLEIVIDELVTIARVASLRACAQRV